jgi:hypothetical protein
MADQAPVLTTDLIVLPTTGEVIDTAEPRAVADAIHEIELLERELRLVKDHLRGLLVDESGKVGSKTLRWGKREAVIKGGSETIYDADEVERCLLDAGMPAERVAEIVVEKVTIEKRVNAREAARAAAANMGYAAIFAQHATVVEKKPSVTVT